METIAQQTGPQRPVFFIQYEGKDISADISRDFVRFVYNDKRSGEADELEIVLENSHGRWTNAWYPEKGDRIRASFGYDGAAMLPCGEFEVDETEFDIGSREVTIKALSAGITRAIRTKHTKAYNRHTLASIARQVAQRNNLVLAGDPQEIPVERVTQNQETDLGFLKRVGDQYGHLMSVRGDQLYLSPLSAIDDRDAVLIVSDETQLKPGSRFRDKTNATYKSVSVAYLDPKSGKLVEHTETAKTKKRKRGDKEVEDKSDTLKLNTRAENKQQAIAMARAALRSKNLKAVEGELSMIGEPRILAGNTLQITCLGKLSGDYLLENSRHTVTRAGGWEVSATGQRLRNMEESKQATTARKAKRHRKGKA